MGTGSIAAVLMTDDSDSFTQLADITEEAGTSKTGLVRTSVPFALGGKQCKLQHRDATGTRRSSCNFDVRVNAGGRRSTLL
jgi:hypothetical protein